MQNGRETSAVPKDRLYYGELVGHGRDHFNRDPHEEKSYYVILATSTGTQELWGKDLERALADSKPRPKIGDQIGVRQTVVRKRNSDGLVIATRLQRRCSGG